MINKFQIPPEQNGILFDEQLFTTLLEQIHAAPWEWDGLMRSRNDGS